jgi:hypothetical protein
MEQQQQSRTPMIIGIVALALAVVTFLWLWIRVASRNLFANTVSAKTSGSTVTINGAQFRAGSVSSATTLTAADSGTVYDVSQASAYAITLPAPVAGVNYTFVLGTAGSNAVTIGTASGNNYFYGVRQNALTGIAAVSAADTITFVSGTAAVGDRVEIYALSSTKWDVNILCSANGGITTSAS